MNSILSYAIPLLIPIVMGLQDDVFYHHNMTTFEQINQLVLQPRQLFKKSNPKPSSRSNTNKNSQYNVKEVDYERKRNLRSDVYVDIITSSQNHSASYASSNSIISSSTSLPFGSHMKVKEKELLLHEKASNNQRKYHGDMAVIHIGPHKTATTTIQHAMKLFMDKLYEDGYHIPGDWSPYSWVNMMTLSDCLKKEYKNYSFSYDDFDDKVRQRKTRQRQILRSSSSSSSSSTTTTESASISNIMKETKTIEPIHRNLVGGSFPCNVHMLDEIKQIASQTDRQNNNLLLTAESFSGQSLVMNRVKELLKPWNKVIVVVYYRRFYEWFHSQWNQMYKDANPDTRPHFIDFITANNGSNIDHYAIRRNYILGTIPNWEDAYMNPDTTILTTTGQPQQGEIHLYNLHDLPESTISESFFCHSIPNATKTCNEVRRRIKTYGDIKNNPSVPFIYSDLAYLAQQQPDVLLLTEQAKSYPLYYLIRLVRNFQEQKLGLTQYDFDDMYRSCPPQSILDKLLHYTYKAEEKYFPQFFHSEKGKVVIDTRFEKDSRTKLCTINATLVLQMNQTWQQFFQSL